MKIIQISAVFCQEYREEIQIYGLGDDGKVYVLRNYAGGQKWELV